MKLKINASISLSTGHTATAAVIELFNERFDLANTKFEADLKVWKTQADKDAGKDFIYLFGSERITNISYAIPGADLAQAATDGHYGIIGTNHPTRIIDELASLLSITAPEVVVTDLI